MTTRLLLPIALLALGSCNTISEAPEGSPRVEAEVAALVNASIHDTLAFDSIGMSAEETFSTVVTPLSDLGTRFYAVPSADYQQGHARPQYVLTVELSELIPELIEKEVEVEVQSKVEVDGEIKKVTQLQTELDSLTCLVTAKLERRREGAPALIIGRSEGVSELSVGRLFSKDREPVRMIPLRQQPATGEFFEVREDDFSKLIERAAVRALQQLEKPVDRELGLMGSPL